MNILLVFVFAPLFPIFPVKLRQINKNLFIEVERERNTCDFRQKQNLYS